MNQITFTNQVATINRYSLHLFEKTKSKVLRSFFILLVFSLLTGFETQAQILWSNSSSWTSFGATKPVAGSAVTIPAGVRMIMDETPPNLANLTIMGTLEFADKDLNLTVGWIMLHGTLQVGTPTTPFTKKAIITLNAPDITENVMGMGTRGIMVMAGKLELHGTPPNKFFTKINDHSVMGAKSLTLLDAVSWNVNDEVIVAPTDYFADNNFFAPTIKGIAQRTQVTAINGTSLSIQDGLNSQRWGKLQYLTKDGMSLTPGVLPAGIAAGTPTVLDERAEVVNLTRNIVIQSVDDALWQNNGFGCHIMIMRMNGVIGEAHLNGIEIKRGGQAGKLGRYPFHWHMLSYEGATTLSDATGQYIRNSTVNQSANRGIVIHGTNGTEVKNNVVYDVRGHGIFTEDASERRNIIDGNIVLKIRNQSDANALKLHETWRNGSSGFWISNPDNTITNNTVADSEGFGFWLAFPIKTFGASKDVPLVPIYTKFGIFDKNCAHSNQKEGLFMDSGESDEAGNVANLQYSSTMDMKEPTFGNGPENVLTFDLSNNCVWKNNVSGIWMAATWGHNYGTISADNTSRFFAGRTNTVYVSLIEKALVVGTSLNYNMNGVTMPNTNGGGDGPRTAFASYHSTADIQKNVIVNFPAIKDTRSGAFALDDYYLIPVDKGTTRNTDNILVNSHPGVRILPWEPQFTLGVLWDHNNYWGGPASQDNYYVFDNPFFTYGQSPHVPQGNPASGGVIVNGPFYGFQGTYVNRIERTYEKINAIRTNAAGAVVGNWAVEAGAPGSLLGNMRHFATHPSGYYYLDYPTIDDVNDFILNVSTMGSTADYQVLSVEYSGNYNVTQLFSSTAYNMDNFGGVIPFPTGQSNTRGYTRVSDFQAVVSAPAGEVFWQDKANNKVWFKVRGGLNPGNSNLPDTHDLNLYKEFKIRAYGELQVLPVSLVNFSGKATSTGNVLSWRTNTEQNNNGFEILRSTNGIEFQKIGFKKSLAVNANSSNSLEYSFTDVTNQENTYYQLKQIDINGKAISSSIIVVKAGFATENQVHPNPASNSFNVTTGNTGAKIIVTTLNGRVIKTVNAISKITTIDSSNWAAGVYLIQVQTGAQTTVKKVLIVK